MAGGRAIRKRADITPDAHKRIAADFYASQLERDRKLRATFATAVEIDQHGPDSIEFIEAAIGPKTKLLSAKRP